jgi:agmatine/peptidylarginine deiminase
MTFTSDERRLPAEWEPQSGVMLTWPHDQGDWGPVLAEVEPVFLRLALEIARRETLLVNCASPSRADALRTALVAAGAPPQNLVFAVVASNDTWARDHGPITVLESGKPKLLDFLFNGWGNKYPAQADNAITGELARRGVFAPAVVETLDLVLEGGSIESDGAGTLLTTACCLLNPQRNPTLSRRQLEQRVCSLLGAQRMLWLEHGELEGDDTDGHIDMLARLCPADTIAYQSCTESTYGGYRELTSMEAELRQLRTAVGQPYRLVPLPWPAAKYARDGSRLPASYANFLIINGALLVPAYDDPADDKAAQQLQLCFPQRDIIQIPARTVIQQYGSLHCLTMQFPQGVEFRTPTAG